MKILGWRAGSENELSAVDLLGGACRLETRCGSKVNPPPACWPRRFTDRISQRFRALVCPTRRRDLFAGLLIPNSLICRSVSACRPRSPRCPRALSPHAHLRLSSSTPHVHSHTRTRIALRRVGAWSTTLRDEGGRSLLCLPCLQVFSFRLTMSLLSPSSLAPISATQIGRAHV